METITLNVYTIDELSDKAKERAHERHQSNGDYPWNSENQSTLYAFEKMLPIKIKDWEYGNRVYVDWTWEERPEIAQLSGVRLRTYIINNCYNDLYEPRYVKHVENKLGLIHPYIKKIMAKSGKVYFTWRSKMKIEYDCTLTGYCIDYNILKPIYEFIARPNDKVNFSKLIDSCLDSWAKACDADYEDYYGMEGFIEQCRGRERLFFEDGSIYQ